MRRKKMALNSGISKFMVSKIKRFWPNIEITINPKEYIEHRGYSGSKIIIKASINDFSPYNKILLKEVSDDTIPPEKIISYLEQAKKIDPFLKERMISELKEIKYLLVRRFA